MPPPTRPSQPRPWKIRPRALLLTMVLLLVGALALTQGLALWLRAPLTAALSATLGVEPRIGGLGLGWADGRPSLTLEEVELRGGEQDDRPRLQMPRLHLVLDPLASLTSLSLQVKALAIEGLRLRLERLEEGRLLVAGLASAGGEAGLSAAFSGQSPLWLDAGRLELSLEGDGNQGQLHLSADQLVLNLPGVFGNRPPIRLERLAGPLAWEQAADGGLRLSSPGLEARNPDLELRLRFALLVPKPAVTGEGAAVDAGLGTRENGGGGPGDTRSPSPVLDLEGEILNAKAAAIRDYLPDPQLKPRGRAWLDRAFPAGRVSQGVILFRGPLEDFPFRQDQGYFHVLLRVEEMDLDFDPDWPPLRGLEGTVHFHNQGLAIATIGGEILGFPLLEAQAEIADLAEPRYLEARGQARGEFARGLAFLGGTPLKRALGPLPGLFIAEGQAQVALDMSLPLDKEDHPEDPLRLTGSLSWPGPASLTPVGTNLTLDGLEGVLGFGQEGVRASRLRARFLGQPLTLDLDRVRDRGAAAEPLTELRLGAVSPLKALVAAQPSPLWRHLEGEVPWELVIRLPDPAPEGAGPQDLAADFALTSDLRGLAVKVPRPLGKTREEKRPLRLEWRVRAGTDTPLRGRYGDLALNLLLVRDAKGELALRRGALALGQEQVDAPAGDGLRLSGRVAELELEPWRAWIRDLGVGLGGGLSGPALTLAGLRIDQLRLGPVQLRDLSLDVSAGAKAWEAQVQARELAGRLSIPFKARAQPLRLELEHLDLRPFLGPGAPETAAKPPEGQGRPPREAPARSDPRQAQALDLVVERLHWSDNDLGRLILRTLPQEGGLEISELRLIRPGQIELEGRGSWSLAAPRGLGPEEAGSRTRLDLEAKTGDLGELLTHLDYASPLADAPARAQARFSWPGGPEDLTLARLEGEIDLEIGSGSLLEVDPGVGRVLGVLNLGALGRRLRLDFTDFYDRGFVFNGIQGRLGLGAGRAELIKPLVIEGSSAEVRIEGRANLMDKTLDQVATVTPSLGGSVALASALAAGPLVGAAVLIADKASGGALDIIGRHAYTIRGPWEEPVISPRSDQEAQEEVQVPLGALGDPPGKGVGDLGGKGPTERPDKASGDRPGRVPGERPSQASANPPGKSSDDSQGTATPRSGEAASSSGSRAPKGTNAFLDQP